MLLKARLLPFILAVLIWPSRANEACQPPTVTSDKESYEPGESATFSCVAKNPVYWNVSVEDDDRFLVTNSTDGSNMFSTTLVIRNVSYVDSKMYQCNPYKDDGVCSGTSVRLFVDDPENLFTEMDMELIHAFLGDDVVIPCIRTSKKVTVILKQEFGDQNVTNADYVDGVGFIKRHIMNDAVYECEASLGDKRKLSNQVHIAVQFYDDTVELPSINDSEARGVGIGDDFTLVCTLSIPYSAIIASKLMWITPSGANLRHNQVTGPLLDETQSNLTIRGATKTDQGNYSCVFPGVDEATTFVKVLGPEHILQVETKTTDLRVKEGNVATWVFEITAFPKATEYIWMDSYGRKIDSNSTFVMTITDKTSVTLKIHKVQLHHAGRYSFHVRNNKDISITRLDLIVKGRPRIRSIQTIRVEDEMPVVGDFYSLGEKYKTICSALGNPQPPIYWKQYENSPPQKLISEGYREVTDDFRRGSEAYLIWEASSSGTILCSLSENSTESEESYADDDERVINIRVVDFPQVTASGLALVGSTDVVETNTIDLMCAAAKDLGSRPIFRWYHDRMEIFNSSANNRIQLSDLFETEFSYRRTLKVIQSRITDGGKYSCGLGNGSIVDSKQVTVHARTPPVIQYTNMNNSKITIQVGVDRIQLKCNASGVPQPSINWFKDGINLLDDGSFTDQFRKSTSPSTIFILSSPSYKGNYSCVASNSQGTVSRYQNIEINGAELANTKTLGYVIGIMGFAILLLVLFAYLRHRKAERLHDRKVANLIQRFREGNVGSINTTMSVTDQVDLLPYDERMEFPRENLQIGKLLGHGAFGRVFKAVAKDLITKGTLTEVAVKEAIDSLDGSNLRALASELKIMIHLGQHVNILNILGACTSDLKKGELLVIVEYCEHGNLLQFMQSVKQKKHFIDLRHAVTKDFNPYDTQYNAIYNRWSALSRQSPTQDIQYTTITFTDSSSTRRDSQGYRAMEANTSSPIENGHSASFQLPVHETSAQSMQSQCNSQFHSIPGSCCTDTTYMTNGEAQSPDSPAYPKSPYGNATFVTTEDLMCWCYQIACGMEYLTSRKVLHGDLAARNILLAKNKIIKICDFGLSRQLYKNIYKKKKKDELLPIKWMAIESILEGKYSPFSDVWSYGVVMWEIFTLGNSPYPGQDLNDPSGKFYIDLRQGHRMEEPDYSPVGLYDLMLHCWNANPMQRPSWTHILTILEKYMTDETCKYYSKLNEPYSKLSVEKMEGRQDYLQLMGNNEFVNKELTPDNVPYENVERKQRRSNESVVLENLTQFISGQQQVVNNETYKIMEPSSAQETELSEFPKTQPLEPVVEEMQAPAFMNNGYVLNSIFDANASNLDPFPNPLPDIPTPLPDQNKLSPRVRRHKLDSGVYSMESHHYPPGSSPVSSSPGDDVILQISHGIENQHYFHMPEDVAV